MEILFSIRQLLYLVQQLLFIVVIAAPIFLYFKNRRSGDFFKSIKFITKIDTLYLAIIILISIVLTIGGFYGIRFLPKFVDSVDFILAFAAVFSIYCKLKIVPFKQTLTLFRNPKINKFAVVSYILVTLTVGVGSLITSLNVLIFLALAAVLFYFLFIKFDVLSMGFGSQAKSSGGNSSDGSRCCDTCRHFSYGQCVRNPGVSGRASDSYCCGEFEFK